MTKISLVRPVSLYREIKESGCVIVVVVVTVVVVGKSEQRCRRAGRGQTESVLATAVGVGWKDCWPKEMYRSLVDTSVPFD